MAKVTKLADMRRAEHYNRLMELPDRDLCEMIRAHFESHPALPGEKEMKDKVNGMLKDDQFSTMLPYEKNQLALAYAQTRIREIPLKNAGYLTGLSKEKLPYDGPEIHGLDSVYKADVVLQRRPSGSIGVVGEIVKNGDPKTMSIGYLDDSINNPMNVDSCGAELQIEDYSGGKMTTLSAKLVVDTDLMSGDVIDLDDNMISGLSQDDGMEQ